MSSAVSYLSMVRGTGTHNLHTRTIRFIFLIQWGCLVATLILVSVELYKNLTYTDQESPMCDLGPPFTPPVHVIPANSSRPRCPTTFVTQYFNIPSKHDPEQYRVWIQNLRGMCLLVFTDSPQLWHVEDQVVVVTDICAEGRVLNQSACFWRDQWYHDPEARLHRSYQLYLTWNLKPWFLKEAARLNPFQSDWFFWMDAGYMRISSVGSDDTKSTGGFEGYGFYITTPYSYSVAEGDARGLVPNMDPTVLNFLLIQPFPNDEMHGGYHYVSIKDRIAGNMFGGHAQAVDPWVDLYYQVFREYVDRKWFVGKDQNIMNTLCTEHHEACALIDPHARAWENPWFTMWQCLLGQRDYHVYKLP